MFTDDEKQLEKYIDYKIIIGPLDVEKWSSYFYQILNNAFQKDDDYNVDLINNEEFMNALNRSIFFIRPLLSTPRLIKSFGRHLQERIKSPSQYINRIDLILLTVIQTINARLFLWISKNRLRLVDKYTLGNELWAVYPSEKYFNYIQNEHENKEKEKEEIIKELKEIAICSDGEIELIKIIFFNENNIYNSFKYKFSDNKSEALMRQRVVDNYYFSHYFFRNDLPAIAKPKGFKLLEHELIKTEDVEVIVEFLFNEYNESKSISELFYLTLFQILEEDIISFNAKVKLLIATAILINSS